MRIVRIEDLHADGGWRTFSFVKLTTDEGLVGWSEYSDASWSPGLTQVIRRLAESVIGWDPRRFAKLSAELRAMTRMAAGGLADQAIGAIENACLDVAAKAAGVPVAALFGGPLRDRLRLYWSHCGSFRASSPDLFERVIGAPPLRSLDDVTALGREVKASGYRALKTNPILFEAGGPRLMNPGFRPGLDFARNAEPRVIEAIADQIEAFRAGTGPDIAILLDVNFGFSAEALRLLARRLDPLGLAWLESDTAVPEALALVRRECATPLASLEAVYGVRGYRPYLAAGAVDVAIIDVVWNGFGEAIKIAALAEAHDVNVAPHNFYGHLATMISAQLAAAVPNFRIMENEGEDVPWKDAVFTHAPEIVDGEMIVPTRPGWGTEVNEAALEAHPPRGPSAALRG